MTYMVVGLASQVTQLITSTIPMNNNQPTAAVSKHESLAVIVEYSLNEEPRLQAGDVARLRTVCGQAKRGVSTRQLSFAGSYGLVDCICFESGWRGMAEFMTFNGHTNCRIDVIGRPSPPALEDCVCWCLYSRQVKCRRQNEQPAPCIEECDAGIYGMDI